MSEVAYRKEEKDSFIFVEFKFGDPSDPTYIRYTDMEYSKSLFGNEYVSLPTMEVTYPKISGGLNDPAAKIDLPLTLFTLAISNGEPTSEIEITIRELLTAAHDSSVKVRFRGIAERAIRNYSGNRKIVRINILQDKNFYDVAAGVSADNQCGWGLGRGGCQVAIESLKEPGIITSLNSNLISLSGLLSSGTLNYFRDGFIYKDGISIKIRDHGNTNDLVLVKRPPNSWLYQSVDVYPGCSKLISRCRTWGQEANFLALGVGIPDYQPIIETP